MKPPPDPSRDLRVVLETEDASLIPVLLAMFEAHGIDCIVQGGQATGTLPLPGVGLGFTRRALRAQLMVSADRWEEAKQLLDSFENDSSRSD